MSDEKHKDFVTDTISLLKQQSIEAKLDADKADVDLEQDSYNQGHLMAYYC